jgi:hypothetical protein
MTDGGQAPSVITREAAIVSGDLTLAADPHIRPDAHFV